MARRPKAVLGTQVVAQAYELVAIDSIQPHPRNVNEGDIGAIIESVDRNGFIGAAVVQRSTGHILAGKHRWLAAKQQGITEFPVIYADVDDQTALRYMLADNRTSRLGADNPEALAELLQSIRADQGTLSGTGFDDEALQELLEDLGQPFLGGQEDAPEPQMDRAEELLAKWHVERGQIWQIGNPTGNVHRLMCGDCTNLGDVASLMRSEIPTLMWTDPPYGVDYGRLVASRQNQKQGGWDDIKGDALSDEALAELLDAALAAPGAKIAFVWHPPGARRFLFWDALKKNGWNPSQEIIWVKNALVFGRADYQWRHEPCIYARREGAGRQLDRTETTVWEENKPHDSEHPTQKPIELCARPIRNHTEPGDIVFDPFLGSGTAMVAAQQLERICYGLEIEPKYCAVILERLSAMGLVPELVHDTTGAVPSGDREPVGATA